jgi:hypothetical protein
MNEVFIFGYQARLLKVSKFRELISMLGEMFSSNYTLKYDLESNFWELSEMHGTCNAALYTQL